MPPFRCCTKFDGLYQVFRPRTPSEAVDLVAKLLEYTPESRLSAIEAMCHPFFDELRVEGQRMPNGKEFPSLFDFTREGMASLFYFMCLGSDLVLQNCPSVLT